MAVCTMLLHGSTHRHGFLHRIYSILNPWQTPVAAAAVYNTPDDGRKERPKHVEL